MRLTRVYVPNTLLGVDQNVTLDKATTKHLQKVLQLRQGDHCILFNGDGREYTAQIQSSASEVVIKAVASVERESPLHITLVQGIARGEKMDFILQKATELGVNAIFPVYTHHSQVKLDTKRAHARYIHWSGVIASACSQSGRATLPTLSEICPLDRIAEHLPKESKRLMLCPNAQLRFGSCEKHRRYTLAVGPEGGLSERDTTVLSAAGFDGVTIGPRILRTETAALAAISALQTKWGDF